METRSLYNGVTQFEEFSRIASLIEQWDLSVKEGEGYHLGAMHSKYGHLRIKIYKSEYNMMIWNVSEQDIKEEFRFKHELENVARFFSGYISGLRKEQVSLTFEIIGGSFHAVDSSPFGFAQAFNYAIINCFDKVFAPKGVPPKNAQ